MRGLEPGQPDQGPPCSLIPCGRAQERAPRGSKRMSRQGPASRRNQDSTREGEAARGAFGARPLGVRVPGLFTAGPSGQAPALSVPQLSHLWMG